VACGGDANAEPEQKADNQREEVNERIGKWRPDEAGKGIRGETEQDAGDNNPPIPSLEGAFGCAIFDVAVHSEFTQR